MRSLHFERVLFAVALALGLSHSAQAGDLSITESTMIDCGTILDGGGTSITMDTNDTITSDPDALHLGGTVASGVYVVSGDANCNVKVTFNSVFINGIKLRSFTTNPASVSNISLGATGALTITLGAICRIQGSAQPGIDQTLDLLVHAHYRGSCSGNGLDADVNHDGEVDMYAQLGLSETTELDFGTVTDENGTITLGLSDSITSDANGISIGGTIASGVYTVTGQANVTVSMSLAGSSAAGLTIGSFTSSEADLGTVSLGAGGSNAITLGADLTVASATAPPGANQALSFTVTVNYN